MWHSSSTFNAQLKFHSSTTFPLKVETQEDQRVTWSDIGRRPGDCRSSWSTTPHLAQVDTICEVLFVPCTISFLISEVFYLSKDHNGGMGSCNGKRLSCHAQRRHTCPNDEAFFWLWPEDVSLPSSNSRNSLCCANGTSPSNLAKLSVKQVIVDTIFLFLLGLQREVDHFTVTETICTLSEEDLTLCNFVFPSCVLKYSRYLYRTYY